MRAIPHPALKDVTLAQVLYALSDPVRLGVVRQLSREGQATCSALDGGRPKSSMSHHFKVLREGGLVFTRTDGPAHLNELRRDEINERFPGLLDAVLDAARQQD
ncbi:DNA-binding transcriptional ArsR family regulator [Rhizobium skierniewicense]|uniref:DNA-binding transcriptional ArsR family regulator n=1 Tax=Rhizobium skierniewicense TaxID=984260 RepID=A0A7W6C636_9HYPH|nr:helix-turn-helix domain-containing protein [Rhizobium skierniewicense]MBB3945114.1 DNA-binding transcriptional ArsR family regulator [Rhizobium skierniewicense]NTF34470.1 helix-turn-helix transcriptional regulator [Rhizobium skierniewicense]